jgi:hypothetical protein
MIRVLKFLWALISPIFRSEQIMKMPWKQIGLIGLQIAGAVVPSVHQVEVAFQDVKGAKGSDKQQAALNLVMASLASVEQFTNKDLLQDADVAMATKGVIDAVVALQNIIAAKHAAK